MDTPCIDPRIVRCTKKCGCPILPLDSYGNRAHAQCHRMYCGCTPNTPGSRPTCARIDPSLVVSCNTIDQEYYIAKTGVFNLPHSYHCPLAFASAYEFGDCPHCRKYPHHHELCDFATKFVCWGEVSYRMACNCQIQWYMGDHRPDHGYAFL